MKKKILFIITKSSWGGAQRYVYDLAVNLPKDQYEIAVACGGTGELVRRSADAHIPVMEIPNLERDISIVKEVRALFSIMDIVRSARPDILHINSSKAGGLGALAGRIMGVKKIIFTVHGWPFREKRNALWRLLVWLASWATLLLSTTAIAVSHKDLEDSPIPKKTVYIGNGVQPVEFLSRKDARAALFKGAPENELWAGTIAELTRNKGVDILVKAARSMPTTRFFIIGDGEERNYLEALARSLGVHDRVVFMGTIPEAYRLVPALDIFILPSRKEGLPYTVLEAGMAGAAVIASTTGGIPEIVRNGETGVLVPPEDEKALIRAVESLSKNPEKRIWLGRNLRAFVLREHAFDEMLKKTLRVYG